jgi:hypothetical protein
MNETLVSAVERWLNLLYIAASGAGLRDEDRRKAPEVASLLLEIGRLLTRHSRKAPFILVDAAAGKSYVGLLAARLILEPSKRPSKVVFIERNAYLIEQGRCAAGRLQTSVPLEWRRADVADSKAWPEEPAVVSALHACGPSADAVIDGAIASRARALLLVPCCTSSSIEAAARSRRRAEQLGFPRHAHVRNRFIQACVDAERTWRLEAEGYETEVVEFVGATITPHNLLWRARRVQEPSRMAAARRALAGWKGESIGG